MGLFKIRVLCCVAACSTAFAIRFEISAPSIFKENRKSKGDWMCGAWDEFSVVEEFIYSM
jgi:hypothetical protein